MERLTTEQVEGSRDIFDDSVEGKPLRDYSSLVSHPEIARFLENRKNPETKALFEQFFQSRGGIHILDSIVSFYQQSEGKRDRAFESQLGEAIFREIGFSYMASVYERQEAYLLSPEETATLYGDNNSGGLILHKTEAGLEIKSIVLYKFASGTVRLGFQTERQNEEIKKILRSRITSGYEFQNETLKVAPQMDVIYVLPLDSRVNTKDPFIEQVSLPSIASGLLSRFRRMLTRVLLEPPKPPTSSKTLGDVEKPIKAEISNLADILRYDPNFEENIQRILEEVEAKGGSDRTWGFYNIIIELGILPEDIRSAVKQGYVWKLIKTISDDSLLDVSEVTQILYVLQQDRWITNNGASVIREYLSSYIKQRKDSKKGEVPFNLHYRPLDIT